MAWIALIACGALAGVAMVGALALTRRAQPLAIIVMLAALSGSAWGLTTLIAEAGRFDVAAAATMLGIASAFSGYSLGAGLLLSARPRAVPPAGLEPGGDDPRTAVIVLADIEPRTYSPADAASVMRLMEEADVPPVPITLAPFLFAGQRARYQGVGGLSPAHDSVRAVAMRLRTLLDAETFADPVIATCDRDDPLSEVVAGAVSAGHRTVIVASLAVGSGRPADAAMRAVDALRPPDAGVRVMDAGVLWYSDAVASLVARRALSACEGAEDSTGVVLVAHGQPPAWERMYPDYDGREIAFLSRVQGLLVDGGLRPGNVRVAWSGWRDPDVPEAVRHLAALGCARVLVSPACDPVECLDTLLDLPAAVRIARVSVPTRVLSAWGDAPEVAEALASAVRKAAADAG